MSDLFVDTSGLLCYFDEDDAQYQRAKELIEAPGRRHTSSYVLAEFTALAEARGFPRRSALDFAVDLLGLRLARIIWIDEGLHTRGLGLLLERLDKTYSLCDAVSFVVMRDLGISEALTTDRHFEQEGFIKLLR